MVRSHPPKMPANVDLRLVSMADPETNASQVWDGLAGLRDHYDVIVIDGMYRPNMVEIACEYLSPRGIIIVDELRGLWHMGGVRRARFQPGGLLRQRAGGRPAALHIHLFQGVGVRIRPPDADARYLQRIANHD